MPTLKLWSVVAVAVPASLYASTAFAAEVDAEKVALEKRVADLERQLGEVNRKLAESGSNQAGDELSQRVEELEKLAGVHGDGMFGAWKNTTWLRSPSGRFKIRIGGRVQNDWSGFFSDDDFQRAYEREFEGGTEFRRARLHVGGTIYDNVDFMAEFDFAGGHVAFRDVNIATKLCDFGELKIGSMKEPFGFDEIQSDLFTNFNERHIASQAFAPSYNIGAQFSNTCMDGNVQWAVGMFRQTDDDGTEADDIIRTDSPADGDTTDGPSSGDVNFTGRVTGRPWVAAEDQYLHIGGAASYRNPAADAVRFAANSGIRRAGAVVDTGMLESDHVWLGELEAGFVSGPFHAQYEFMWANVDATGSGTDASFHGMALQGGWFITGESRPYNNANGTFGRITPKHDFDSAGGSGAWELVARWDLLDLDDSGIEGGDLHTLGIGVNWYLNPNTRFMLSWVRGHVEHVGHLDGVQARFQIDF
jgi:phosphate-selective porin OprO/OprP